MEELLYPLNAEMAEVHRKPPPHCTSPDVTLQLAIASGSKEDRVNSIPVYDRVTGKRVFRPAKRGDKGKSLAVPHISSVSCFIHSFENKKRCLEVKRGTPLDVCTKSF